jgi:hypothetical protein
MPTTGRFAPEAASRNSDVCSSLKTGRHAPDKSGSRYEKKKSAGDDISIKAAKS